jgi:glycosyltransferase involved in cell wall biosynthesis|tara:strand:- start:608 stop:1447 length:840 start_codon:yes stop_codon:yes gene_type:complete
MTLPRVAVIISNYNYGDFVIDAIDSALSQDYEGEIRVYVLDDGSSDGSWDKISSYAAEDISSITDKHEVNEPYYKGSMESFKCSDLGLWCYRIENSGASTARNVAMWEAWSWADYFAILDADDMYHPSKVRKHVDALLKYEEVGVSYSDYIVHKTHYGNVDYKKYEYKYPYSIKELHHHCIVHSAGVIKKRHLERIILDNKEFYDSALHGPASKGFIGCTEDYDLWIRLGDVCMINHIAEPLSFVRETGQNQSMKMDQNTFINNMQKIKSRHEQIHTKN